MPYERGDPSDGHPDRVEASRRPPAGSLPVWPRQRRSPGYVCHCGGPARRLELEGLAALLGRINAGPPPGRARPPTPSRVADELEGPGALFVRRQLAQRATATRTANHPRGSSASMPTSRNAYSVAPS